MQLMRRRWLHISPGSELMFTIIDPQQLSYKEFNRELRKIFGRLIEHYNENVERNTSRRNKFNTSGRPNEAPVDSRNGNNDHHALMKARHHHHASV
mmetsp:Transcript_30597/g.49088  ORF Transcript_30597/g.49088 Transcript_30597/m.49088 type:complete len:96 (-) Transcript_30597:119-406(-)